MNKLPEHDCTLRQDTYDVLKQVVDSGVFIEWRRKWHRFIMLSRKHPLTASHYKSAALCRREEIRHIITHKNIISPFSMCCWASQLSPIQELISIEITPSITRIKRRVR
ncbi:unnamed protein product [Acanthoscelides obtectus]|uniref:Uncharacterized protein n=1 Tax=Acanthoscelides obtectus TaxID=200917 RepID=A0A9P0LZM5_ACAOB|nr:unnamed protein product [Acanthoscelides obtectus]CAK1632787.1 hypothetical protein AOBTE_LOCUS7728 [Acanthoscelides obtectus]